MNYSAQLSLEDQNVAFLGRVVMARRQTPTFPPALFTFGLDAAADTDRTSNGLDADRVILEQGPAGRRGGGPRSGRGLGSHALPWLSALWAIWRDLLRNKPARGTRLLLCVCCRHQLLLEGSGVPTPLGEGRPPGPETILASATGARHAGRRRGRLGIMTPDRPTGLRSSFLICLRTVAGFPGVARCQ